MSQAALIAENLARVRDRIVVAATSAGRHPEDVRLVGVTKYVGPAGAAALLAAGCTDLGESRPQELWEKAADPALSTARWHLVGHLQRNKVRRTLPLVELVHSVDSLRLAEAINDTAAEIGRPARVLLEVNCSGDVEKHGLTADGLKELLPQLAPLAHLQACGLMTMAARVGDDRVAAANFSALRRLRDAVARDCPPSVQLSELSMGMSGDFEIAIREGATIVRIGSDLFAGVL
jgi:hypothetical protein